MKKSLFTFILSIITISSFGKTINSESDIFGHKDESKCFVDFSMGFSGKLSHNFPVCNEVNGNFIFLGLTYNINNYIGVTCGMSVPSNYIKYKPGKLYEVINIDEFPEDHLYESYMPDLINFRIGASIFKYFQIGVDIYKNIYNPIIVCYDESHILGFNGSYYIKNYGEKKRITQIGFFGNINIPILIFDYCHFGVKLGYSYSTFTKSRFDVGFYGAF